MRISDEKRREVAAKLRAEAESWRCYRGEDNAFCMNDYEFTEAVLEDFGFGDMDMPAYEVFDQMADIVDRPTCHLLPSSDGGFGCDRCYTWFPSMKEKPRFCPECGAMVVTDDD